MHTGAGTQIGRQMARADEQSAPGGSERAEAAARSRRVSPAETVGRQSGRPGRLCLGVRVARARRVGGGIQRAGSSSSPGQTPSRLHPKRGPPTRPPARGAPSECAASLMASNRLGAVLSSCCSAGRLAGTRWPVARPAVEQRTPASVRDDRIRRTQSARTRFIFMPEPKI
jgi:hypothetical protein